MKNRFRVIYFISSKKLTRLKCYDDERFTRFNSSTFVVWREQLKLISEQVRNFFEKKMQETANRLKRARFLQLLVDNLQVSDSNDRLGMFLESMNETKRNSFEWQACVSPSISWSLSRWKHKSTKKETKFVLRKFKIPLSGYVRSFLYRRCLNWHYRQHVNFTWKRLISIRRWYAVSFSFSFSFVRILRRTRGQQEHAAESESESFAATKARGSLLRWQGRAMAGSRSSRIEKQSRNEDSCSCPLARGTRRNCKRFDVRRGIFLAIEISKYQTEHFYMME